MEAVRTISSRIHDHPYIAIAALLLIIFTSIFCYWANKMQREQEAEDKEALAELAEVNAREERLALERQQQTVHAFLGPCEGCNGYEHRCCG